MSGNQSTNDDLPPSSLPRSRSAASGLFAPADPEQADGDGQPVSDVEAGGIAAGGPAENPRSQESRRGSNESMKQTYSGCEMQERDYLNECLQTKKLRHKQVKTFALLQVEMRARADAHGKAAHYYKMRYYLLMLPSIILSVIITALANFLSPGEHTYNMTVGILSAINALLTAMLAFLKYAQKMDAHDQARVRFEQMEQQHTFMIHTQQFAYMSMNEVLKKFQSTRTGVLEASRACPYAFPQFIQIELRNEIEAGSANVMKRALDDEDGAPDMAGVGSNPTPARSRRWTVAERIQRWSTSSVPNNIGRE